MARREREVVRFFTNIDRHLPYELALIARRKRDELIDYKFQQISEYETSATYRAGRVLLSPYRLVRRVFNGLAKGLLVIANKFRFDVLKTPYRAEIERPE